MMDYAFCESAQAPPLGAVHLRRLDGPLEPGGHRYVPLCDRRWVLGWDLSVAPDDTIRRWKSEICASCYSTWERESQKVS